MLLWPRTAKDASRPAVEAANGIVVSTHRLASEAGIAMLQQGGNAIDAAVAVGYAEAVVDPCCGNIGGGGFLVAHLHDGGDVFLNFRETAPAAATRDMYLDAQGNAMYGASLYGWRAVAVPGTVMGLDTALTRYGTLPRSVVMAPAISLARDGFELTRFDTDILQRGTALLRRDVSAARIFLHPDGSPLEPGERLVQPGLAATLASIAADGPQAFYRGRIADAVETASRAGNGIVTSADFAAYRVTQSTPLSCNYRGYVFLSAPPPSSGGVTLCEILHVLEGYDMRTLGFHSAQTVHVMTEAMRHAYFDRNTYLGDPAFVTNPLSKLLSSDHAAAIRAQIGDRATPSDTLGAWYRTTRAYGDDALFGYRQGGQRGRGDLHTQRQLWCRRSGRRYRIPAKQRNGRLHRQARTVEPIPPGAGRSQRHSPGQATVVLNGADSRAARWPRVPGVGLAGRSAHHHHNPGDSVEHPGL